MFTNITSTIQKYDPKVTEAWGDKNATSGVMEDRQILRRYQETWVLDINVNFNNIHIPLTEEQAQDIIRGAMTSYQGTITPRRKVMAIDSEGIAFVATHMGPHETEEEAIQEAKEHYPSMEIFYIQ